MKQPEIIEVIPQGFCGGVCQALQKVTQLTKRPHQKPVTILGALVHNDYVSQALKEQDIRVLEAKGRSRLDMLDEIDSGTVVFTAHGAGDALYEKAAAKGLEILDASCPFVLKTKALIKEKHREGFYIFYAGKKGHPEAEAVCTSLPDGISLIEQEEDIPAGIEQPIFVTNQTTMSILDLKDLFDAIKKRYPQAVIYDEICSATRVRQQALLDLKDQDVDALIVVGDPSSNNTRQLEAIGKQAGIPLVLRIETARDLDRKQVEHLSRIAVTSGASTPKALRDQVIAWIRDENTDLTLPMDHMLDI